MSSMKVELNNVSVRFRMSYDKNLSLVHSLIEKKKTIFEDFKPDIFEALKNVSLKIHGGDIIGVIGPNGSGKSTLLRTISGIYYPDEGTVNTFGKISTLLSLGTGFDNRMNGIDNIKMNGLMLGIDKHEVEAMIPQIEAFADIGDHLYVPMKYYSSGMISRVSFAIVLAMKPDILLIDEIFSVGDLKFQKKSEKIFGELLQQASCQVFVTHSLDFVLEHCTRAIYIQEGQIVEDGPPSAVVDSYRKDSL